MHAKNKNESISLPCLCRKNFGCAEPTNLAFPDHFTHKDNLWQLTIILYITECFLLCNLSSPIISKRCTRLLLFDCSTGSHSIPKLLFFTLEVTKLLFHKGIYRGARWKQPTPKQLFQVPCTAHAFFSTLNLQMKTDLFPLVLEEN